MGTLKPGASYIYERVDDVVYARESGSNIRQEIGRDYNLIDQLQEDKLWGDIRRTAKTNPALQEAIERVKITYYLIKDKKI